MVSLYQFTQQFVMLYIANGKSVTDCLERARNAQHVAKLVYDELHEKTELDEELEKIAPSEIQIALRGMSFEEAYEAAKPEWVAWYLHRDNPEKAKEAYRQAKETGVKPELFRF